MSLCPDPKSGQRNTSSVPQGTAVGQQSWPGLAGRTNLSGDAGSVGNDARVALAPGEAQGRAEARVDGAGRVTA